MYRIARSSLRLIGATAAICAATVAAQPASAAPGTTACASSGLVVWLNTESDGAAGSIFYNLELTNLSGHSCSLTGFPGVSAIDLNGNQLGSAASRDTTHPSKTITLAAGATATAVLRIVEAGNFPSSNCGEVTAAGLRVYPPNRTAAKTIPFPFEACSKSGEIYLTVAPVAKPA